MHSAERLWLVQIQRGRSSSLRKQSGGHRKLPDVSAVQCSVVPAQVSSTVGGCCLWAGSSTWLLITARRQRRSDAAASKQACSALPHSHPRRRPPSSKSFPMSLALARCRTCTVGDGSTLAGGNLVTTIPNTYVVADYAACWAFCAADSECTMWDFQKTSSECQQLHRCGCLPAAGRLLGTLACACSVHRATSARAACTAVLL